MSIFFASEYYLLRNLAEIKIIIDPFAQVIIGTADRSSAMILQGSKRAIKKGRGMYPCPLLEKKTGSTFLEYKREADYQW